MDAAGKGGERRRLRLVQRRKADEIPRSRRADALLLFDAPGRLPAGGIVEIQVNAAQVRLPRAARDALLASTEDDVTISALAQELGASSSQLAASFRGVYGMTPAAFLRAQKMHSAAQLLRTSDRTVLDIAGQFGYDNASKFAKAFRSVIGVSPSAYRAGADSDSCAPTAEKAE